jgi:hypothetical protein
MSEKRDKERQVPLTWQVRKQHRNLQHQETERIASGTGAASRSGSPCARTRFVPRCNLSIRGGEESARQEEGQPGGSAYPPRPPLLRPSPCHPPPIHPTLSRPPFQERLRQLREQGLAPPPPATDAGAAPAAASGAPAAPAAPAPEYAAPAADPDPLKTLLVTALRVQESTIQVRRREGETESVRTSDTLVWPV